MSDTQVLMLVIGILVGVVLIIGGIAGFIFWYHRRPLPEPVVTDGSHGPVARIPTRQISVVRSSTPWLALTKYAVRGTLTISAAGIEHTRPLLRPKRVPAEHISHVVPGASPGTRLGIHFTNGWGIVALTGSPQDRALAVAELSRWYPVTP